MRISQNKINFKKKLMFKLRYPQNVGIDPPDKGQAELLPPYEIWREQLTLVLRRFSPCMVLVGNSSEESLQAPQAAKTSRLLPGREDDDPTLPGTSAATKSEVVQRVAPSRNLF